jgi:hypothetical protein
MSVKYYHYYSDKNIKLSEHFKVGEFCSESDYHGSYPDTFPIETRLVNMLEDLYSHFDCGKIIINSGYRTPQCDIEVGGSGSGPHTYGKAVDAYLYYKNGKPVPSRLVACYLQDRGQNGIGLNCGGNVNGTHIDFLDRKWHADETHYNTVADFYSYTGTKKSEVYPNGNTSDGSASVKTVQKWLGVTADGIPGRQTKTALIKKLQTALNKAYGSKLAVDGVFGNKTSSAVRNIKNGSHGEIVKALQALLICQGYTLTLDGIFGNNTEGAVRDYQSTHGLYNDGIAGKATFGELCC